jgi:hypothetical protein
MKNVIIFLCAVLFAYPAMAQDETLLRGDIESGGYGGPLCAIGELNGEPAVFIGGKGGWIMNHRFVLGGKGYASVKPAYVEGLQNIVVGFACGGASFEYVISSNKLLHFSIENMIGFGIAYNDVGDYKVRHVPIDYTGDAGLVLEPGINLILISMLPKTSELELALLIATSQELTMMQVHLTDMLSEMIMKTSRALT